MGIYNIAVYAMDRKGNTSDTEFTTLSRNLTRRAVIVGGGAGGELSHAMIEKNASLAYNALISQRYNANEINFMNPLFTKPTTFYLGAYLEGLAGDENLDLTIYLIGSGDTRTFTMNDDPEGMNDDDKFLTASQLDAWLDVIQGKPSRVTLIYDGNKSGSFIQALMPPEGKERIIIASTGPESAAYFKTEGSVSFSSFFWDRVASGATTGDAFLYAKSAIAYCSRMNDISFSCYRPQHPSIDANGNSIANELTDYEIAEVLYLGDGVAYADDPPLIGSVSVVRDGNLLTITAHDVSSTKPVTKVWAVIRPISYCPGTSEDMPQEVFEQELFDPDENGTYSYTLNIDNACKVTVYAMSLDTEGEPNISAPSEPIINQPGGDIYEDPDGNGIFDDDPLEANVIVVNYPSPQPHTFHHPDDEDWVKFYGVTTEEGHVYTIEAGNLTENCPVIELYKEGNLSEPIAVASEYPVNNKIWLDFACTKNGIYYVKLFRGNCTYIEGEMSYDLQVYDGNIGLTALVAGKVRDSVSGKAIDGAVITSNGIGAAISTRGDYIFSEVPGNWTITARKESYASSRASLRIEAVEEYIRKDIAMYPISASGCATAADCDDGIFCNGVETCVDKTCQPGTNPCPDDGIFCNGSETCSEDTDACGHAGNPCQLNLTCDEEWDACVGCLEDSDCNDGLFCNGIETCLEGACRPGTYPCPEGVTCDEEADECELPTLEMIPRAIMQSHWIPLPVFMSIRGIHTHFNSASRVTFTPPSVMALPMLINPETLLCFGLMLPAWVTGQAVESIVVSVTTGIENATGSVDIMLLPFLLGEEKQESEDRIQ